MAPLCTVSILFILVLSTNALHREEERDLDLDEDNLEESKGEYRRRIEKWEAEQIDQIKNVTNPYLTPSSLNATKPLKAFWWILEYDSPFETGEIFLIILWPMILGRLIHYLLKPYRPVIKHKNAELKEFPLIPLVFLQATAGERQMKTESRNGLHWLAQKYIVTASDEYVNLNIGGKQYQERMGITKKPWSLAQQVETLQGWWMEARKRLGLTTQPIHLQNEQGGPGLSTLLRKEHSGSGSTAQRSLYNPGISKAISMLGLRTIRDIGTKRLTHKTRH